MSSFLHKHICTPIYSVIWRLIQTKENLGICAGHTCVPKHHSVHTIYIHGHTGTHRHTYHPDEWDVNQSWHTNLHCPCPGLSGCHPDSVENLVSDCLLKLLKGKRPLMFLNSMIKANSRMKYTEVFFLSLPCCSLPLTAKTYSYRFCI